MAGRGRALSSSAPINSAKLLYRSSFIGADEAGSERLVGLLGWVDRWVGAWVRGKIDGLLASKGGWTACLDR